MWHHDCGSCAIPRKQGLTALLSIFQTLFPWVCSGSYTKSVTVSTLTIFASYYSLNFSTKRVYFSLCISKCKSSSQWEGRDCIEGQGFLQEQEALRSQLQMQAIERAQWKWYKALVLKPAPSDRPTSSCKVLTPKPPQTMPLTGYRVFKCWRL